MTHPLPSLSALFVVAALACGCGGNPAGASTTPTATLNITPLGEPIVEVTRLSFAGSVRGASDPQAFRWEFGDGETATGPNVDHVYHSVGLFGVRLTVDGSSGSLTARGSVRARNLSGSWYSPRTSSPFTPSGFPIDFPINLRQTGDRLEGEVPSLAWCPIYRDPVTGFTAFSRVSGQIRHPLSVSFAWACSSFEGVVDLWADTLNSASGQPIYYRR